MGAMLLTVLIGIMAISAVPVLAHPHDIIAIHDHGESHTQYMPLDGVIGLEITTLPFSAPADNTLPWGFVEGKIANHVAGYPVIIHMFSDESLVHYAQTDVTEDGSYEYQFRVRSIDDGEAITPFLGDYTVIVYKVVYPEPPGAL